MTTISCRLFIMLVMRENIQIHLSTLPFRYNICTTSRKINAVIGAFYYFFPFLLYRSTKRGLLILVRYFKNSSIFYQISVFMFDVRTFKILSRSFIWFAVFYFVLKFILVFLFKLRSICIFQKYFATHTLRWVESSIFLNLCTEAIKVNLVNRMKVFISNDTKATNKSIEVI